MMLQSQLDGIVNCRMLVFSGAVHFSSLLKFQRKYEKLNLTAQLLRAGLYYSETANAQKEKSVLE
jgi:hypothetical protein